MHFNWILFLGISIVGSYLGGKMCGILERKVTGGVRTEPDFRRKRTRSSLISILVSYVATTQIMFEVTRKADTDFNILMHAISLAIGINIYLFVQNIIYRFMIRNARY